MRRIAGAVARGLWRRLGFGIPGVHTVELYVARPRPESGMSRRATSGAQDSWRTAMPGSVVQTRRLFHRHRPGHDQHTNGDGSGLRRFDTYAGDIQRQPHRSSRHGRRPAARTAIAAQCRGGCLRLQPHLAGAGTIAAGPGPGLCAFPAPDRARSTSRSRSTSSPAMEPALVAVRPLPRRPGPRREDIEQAATLLRSALSAAGHSGGGASGAAVAALRLIERPGSSGHQYGQCQRHSAARAPAAWGENMAFEPIRRAISTADVVLAVGTELGETEMYPDPQPRC